MNIPPFAPEPLPALFARFPAALTPDYDLALVESGRQPMPALQARHRFDFEDGTRMIASVELAPLRELHLSFGIHTDRQKDWAGRGSAAWRNACEDIIAQLQDAKLIPAGRWNNQFITARAIHLWYRL